MINIERFLKISSLVLLFLIYAFPGLKIFKIPIFLVNLFFFIVFAFKKKYLKA